MSAREEGAPHLDFHIAIPSRGRVREFYLQTYRKLIYRFSLEAETTVFVQTEEDRAAYAAAFPRVGLVLTPGLGQAAAQEAIRRHYPPGARVVVLHDDVTRVVRLKDGTARRFEDVRRLFRTAFELMERFGVSLGGMAPTTNALNELQSARKVTLSLRFIYDPLHFELNPSEPLITKSVTKQDAERSIQHYERCGGVLRLAGFAVSTRHRPSARDRAADTADCELMRREYPGAIAQVRTHRGGYSSLVLAPKPYRGVSAHADPEAEAERLFQRLLGDFEVTPDLELPGGRLLRLLQQHAWNVNELRTAVVPPERRVISVSKRNKLASLRADMPVYSETLHEGPIFEACQAVLPTAQARFDYVTVNKNICCHPHRDAGNSGRSLILFLGKFEGGALLTEDGQRFEQPGVLHAFDGSRLHWNEPITGGTKYSIVFYNRSAALPLAPKLRSATRAAPQAVEIASGSCVPFDLYG